MGEQVECTIRFEDRVAAGRAQLESDAIIFRGEFKLSIPLNDIWAVDAANGQLIIDSPAGSVSFTLGDRAEKWAQKIKQPKSLIDKLGIKPGSRVSVIGISDESFWRQLIERTPEVSKGRLRKDSDFVVIMVEATAELERFAGLRHSIKDNGAIWVVWPKGSPNVGESDVRNRGLAAGLVDVKVASFSSAHSALKFVIPLAKRAH